MSAENSFNKEVVPGAEKLLKRFDEMQKEGGFDVGETTHDVVDFISILKGLNQVDNLPFEVKKDIATGAFKEFKKRRGETFVFIVSKLGLKINEID